MSTPIPNTEKSYNSCIYLLGIVLNLTLSRKGKGVIVISKNNLRVPQQVLNGSVPLGWGLLGARPSLAPLQLRFETPTRRGSPFSDDPFLPGAFQSADFSVLVLTDISPVAKEAVFWVLNSWLSGDMACVRVRVHVCVHMNFIM